MKALLSFVLGVSVSAILFWIFGNPFAEGSEDSSESDNLTITLELGDSSESSREKLVEFLSSSLAENNTSSFLEIELQPKGNEADDRYDMKLEYNEDNPFMQLVLFSKMKLRREVGNVFQKTLRFEAREQEAEQSVVPNP